jgi:hypothetical protein
MRTQGARDGAGLPLGAVVHASTGRTRLRFAELRGGAAALAALARRIDALSGVRGTEVRPFTGSILVRHEGDFREVARRATAEGVFQVADDRAALAVGSRAVAHPVPAAVAVAFAGLGVMQLFDRRVLPPALTLFWYAASLAREAMPDGTDASADE